MKILVVEDSTLLRTYLSKALKKAGHTVDLSEDGSKGLWHAQSFYYDVIILDIMLPEINGIEVLEQIRANNNQTHVLLLTAKDTKQDIVLGLRSGADDYMIKPFDIDELIARVEALGRRVTQKKSHVITSAHLTLDTIQKQILVQGQPLKLAHREYTILSYLITHAGEVITRERLEEQIYDMNQNVMSNSLSSAISIIRKQLGHFHCDHTLETRRGIGYLLQK